MSPLRDSPPTQIRREREPTPQGRRGPFAGAREESRWRATERTQPLGYPRLRFRPAHNRNSALADIEADGKVLAHDPRIPLRGVDSFKLAVDIDFLQLVDQDYRRVAVA